MKIQQIAINKGLFVLSSIVMIILHILTFYQPSESEGYLRTSIYAEPADTQNKLLIYLALLKRNISWFCHNLRRLPRLTCSAGH
jgi:hypothetical protein